MPNVNVAELKSSLKQCVEYCREHQDRDYCERHLSRLEEALEDLRESRRETDEFYSDWMKQHRSQRQAWKELAETLREVQDELDRVNAVGYPDERIRYWDEELLEEAVDEMVEYLEEEGDDVESAGDMAGRLERYLKAARDETEQQENARGAYTRRVKKRSDAMGLAINVLADFRDLLREQLGEEHPEYEGIRWPYGVAPDQAVL